MAHAHSDEQVRIILQTMASEFDDQADTADAQGDRKGRDEQSPNSGQSG
jgi:hypothetical protein